MQFYCERSELQAAISTAAKAVSSKSPMPALEGILVEADPKGFLKLTGYDMKKAIYTSIQADVPEPGSMVLNAKIFGEIIHALPDGTVHLWTEQFNTFIQCEKASFHIIGSDAEEYPELPDIDGNSGVSLPQNLLSKMIRQTNFAVSTEETRPIYMGELFEIKNETLTLVAVDGYRLALRRESIESMAEEFSFIVPGTALSDLEKLCSDTEDPVQISLGSKHISFTIGETVLISRRLEGDFLNYEKTVPNKFKIEIRVDRQIFQRIVERVSLVIDDRIKNPIRCRFGDDSIKISCATAVGKAEDYCPADGDGTDLEIGFNNRYLLDALKAAPAEEVSVLLNTGTSPCVISPTDGEKNFLYMILPVRLRPGE